jgi:hypothetical protein
MAAQIRPKMRYRSPAPALSGATIPVESLVSLLTTLAFTADSQLGRIRDAERPGGVPPRGRDHRRRALRDEGKLDRRRPGEAAASNPLLITGAGH